MIKHVVLAVALALAGCSSGADLAAPAAGLPQVTAPAFGDANPHPWSAPGPDAYPVHGIDISRFQSPLDWATVRANGVNFAFIKATEGGDRLDPGFLGHWNGAIAAGVLPGAYHFYYFCTDAETQAANFIASVPRTPGALPPVVDLEWNPFSPTCTYRPPAAEVRAEVGRFMDILQAHYGQRPVVYTTPDFYDRNGFADIDTEEFWLRTVAALPSERYPGAAWTFWQYSSTGLIAGAEGEIDLNAFAGDRAAWYRWLSLRRQR